MLRSMKDMKNFEIGASDGYVGHVKDLYFDDQRWVVRYLVVDASNWLDSRKVLISPIAIHDADWGGRVLPVSITRAQVKNAPNIDADRPVSRQHEIEYSGYYGYPYYWGGGGLWGGANYPGSLAANWDYGDEDDEFSDETTRETRAADGSSRHGHDDPHLRSCKAVTGYHIHASDGEVGHVQDMLVDQDTWAVRYLVVNTSNWWMGHTVLVAPQWITGVRWSDESVSVDLTRQAVKDAPPYDSTVELDREGEAVLHARHNRSGYWVDESSQKARLSQPSHH